MVYTHKNGDVYVILGMVYGIVLATFSMLHVWYSPPIHPQNASVLWKKLAQVQACALPTNREAP